MESEQTLFCLSEISDSKRYLETIAPQLLKLRLQYEKYKGSGLKAEQDSLSELSKTVKKILRHFPSLIQQLSELGDRATLETTEKMYSVLKKYDYLGVSDFTPLCKALLVFASKLPSREGNINKAALGHLMNQVRIGYFPTDTEHVKLIKKAVVFPENKVNLIDPCCGEGIALSLFAEGTNSDTYGVEIDTVRAENAQSRLKRVGFGSFFHSRISNNAFQCLFLNPPYLSAPSEHGNRRLEKSFLADSLRLLEDGGLLIYIIPYYRATADVCRVLCEFFCDLSVYRFTGDEFGKFKQVVFLGKKIPRREAEKPTERLTELMLYPDKIPPLTSVREGVYTLPEASKSVDIFKGAVFNEKELAEQLKRSNSIERLFPISRLDKCERQPLLPLNLSQIGLVGASGMMNGLVKCDTPHIIKGRIVKEKKSRVGPEDEYGKIELKEITSNKLIFNLLTQTGFKSLG